MDLEKLNRKVALLCPTCGGSQFASEEAGDEPAAILKCAGCGLEITHEELVDSNTDNISVNLDEMTKDAVKEVEKEFNAILRNAFKGNKHITIK
jgi:hypothetical protein